MIFWKNVGCGSLFPWDCWLLFITGLPGPARRPGRWAFEFWNWACMDAAGVAVSKPPAAPLWRLACGPPEAFGRSRDFPTPTIAGDGGGGCAAFKRSAVIPGLGAPRAGAPCRSRADELGTALLTWGWCCEEYDLYSHPLPLFSFIQSYSPSSMSPVFLRACVKRSRK